LHRRVQEEWGRFEAKGAKQPFLLKSSIFVENFLQFKVFARQLLTI
jgi:hypothetical protein